MEPPNKKRRTTPLSSFSADGTLFYNQHGSVNSQVPNNDVCNKDGDGNSNTNTKDRSPTTQSAVSASAATQIDESAIAETESKEDQRLLAAEDGVPALDRDAIPGGTTVVVTQAVRKRKGGALTDI